jgi:hypothetical protein
MLWNFGIRYNDNATKWYVNGELMPEKFGLEGIYPVLIVAVNLIF